MIKLESGYKYNHFSEPGNEEIRSGTDRKLSLNRGEKGFGGSTLRSRRIDIETGNHIG